MRSRVLKTTRPNAAIVTLMFRTSLLLATARVAAIAAFTSVVVLAPRALAAPVTPPTPTFQVLHNDHIGTAAVPAGTYTLTPFGGLTPARATQSFSRFLQDYDGVLPSPWTLDPATIAHASRWLFGIAAAFALTAVVFGFAVRLRPADARA